MINLNQVTKSQLRDFVDKKVSKIKSDLKVEIENAATARISIALSEVLGDVSELEQHASKFEDLLTEKIHLLGEKNVPDYATIATNQANKIYKAKKYFLDHIIPKAVASIMNPEQSEYYRFNCKPLMTVFNELASELRPKVNLYRDGLEKLKNELHNAISIESKGKQAYNALVALGLDMADLPQVNPNLPAVTKLSIDVCILNGNCEEKAS